MDAAGSVAQLNDAARLLLGASPGVLLADAVPRWLAEAHRSLGGRRGASGRAESGGAEAGGAEASGTGSVARGPIGEAVYEAHPMPALGVPGGAASTTWWLIDVTERRRLADELATERRRTAFLAEASSRLLASLNLERCMEVTVRLAARHLADAALVIAPASGRAHPISYCGPGDRFDHRELVVDPAEVPGLDEAMKGFPPVPSRWIDPSAAPDWIARQGVGEPGAMVVTALPGHGVPAGALVLLRRHGQEAFSDGEEVFARLFAARAGAAMSAARLYAEQASITETLMRELLPPRARELGGVELAARYRPSGDGERVGGDFYDLYPADPQDPGAESLVVLGDVCGKGLEAAVLTGKIRNTLHALLPMAGDHQRVLELLNGTLLNSDTTRFVTLVLASVRRRGAEVRMRLTSAGHSAPLIVRAGGAVEKAPTGGSLIGVLEEITSTTATVSLRPGDTCLLYTDGITEAVGGPLGDEMFGDERLHAELVQCGGMPPEALVERVHMLAAEWVRSGGHDDMAMVALTAPRRVHLSAVGGQGPGRFTA
nr:PP2C family protein-serine/threonine phosphatase [Actinomadura rugatobispora]